MHNAHGGAVFADDRQHRDRAGLMLLHDREGRCCQLVLGNGVQTIGKYAFGNVNDANKGLSGELVIPASVTDIR